MQIPFFDALQCGNIEFTPYAVIDNQKIAGVQSTFQYNPEHGNAHLIRKKASRQFFFTFEIRLMPQFQVFPASHEANELGITSLGPLLAASLGDSSTTTRTRDLGHGISH